ncbi:MAG TPA: PAS domain-containing protein [Ramlibacter sp.]|uniref:helix-turn-helix transcriptional regulator n=1 Tax=Ramlibacter sp. TaxID=1917967 RepID=UPI002C8BF0B3|nr:PAS domain-containing protein [Ramlibacter sp.]HVZ43909.1 PAS domain-containing protein [Ramlibacter sp.]
MTRKQAPARGAIPPEVQREREAILAALDCIVPMLGAMAGEHVEVVLHDLTHPENSVLRIANGHVTGRSPGSPVLAGPGNDKALAILAEGMVDALPAGHVSVFPYPTITRDGRNLTSGTVMFRDSLGRTFAALCLNADLQGVEAAHALLSRMLPSKAIATTQAKVDAPDMEALMHDIIEQAVRRYGKPVARMNKEEKTAAVESMFERGLFIVKGGVEKAAAALGVTRFTVYNYLDDVKSRRAH